MAKRKHKFSFHFSVDEISSCKSSWYKGIITDHQETGPTAPSELLLKNGEHFEEKKEGMCSTRNYRNKRGFGQVRGELFRFEQGKANERCFRTR